MDKATFSNRLREITIDNRKFATRFVTNHLPDSNRYLVRLNQSCDEQLRPGEHVFPHDTDPAAALTADEVVDLLCRENRVPEWIDISVERADSEHTYLLLLCCGRFTDNDALLYYLDRGNAPFGCKSPSVPLSWSEEQGRFDLHSRKTPAPARPQQDGCRRSTTDKMKRTPLIVAFSLCGLLILGAIGFRITKSLLGSKMTGVASEMAKLPKFAREFEGFRSSGPVNYQIYQQWGRHVTFISGTTSLEAVTNLANSKNLGFYDQSGEDGHLRHMAFTSQVNTQQITTGFSDTDALASGFKTDVGKYFLLRYRYSDGRFTMLFYN
jgi:hypothetical protein